MPHQEAGAEWLAPRLRAGLFDEMGVGKTATLVRTINLIAGQRGVVICPAMLRENFIKEFRQFSAYPLKLCKGRDIHDYSAWSKGVFDVLVTSYEQATRWWPHFRNTKQRLDFVAMDEAHYLKNAEAKRSKAILGYQANGEHGWVSRADQAWWLTGTPIPNDPMDCYTFLRFAGVMPLTPAQFCNRYFQSEDTRYGTRNVVRPECAGELRALLENNSIRRTKKEVGLNLPPIFLTEVIVDGDTTEVTKLVRAHEGLEAAIVEALEQGGLSFLDAQHIATLRRLIGEAKAVPYAHMLVEELQQTTEKKVVFGVHIAALSTVASILHRAGVGYVHVQGSTSEAGRQAAIKAFQNEPNCRVFLGNMKVAGAGTTLTAACELDVLESEWSPGVNAQALMRVHRIGQTRTVRGRFISLADTLDETVTAIVCRKVAAIAEVEGFEMSAAPTIAS